jgi:hypothetical protein
VVLVDQGEVAAVGAEDLGKWADVAPGGGADPKAVAAADGLVRRQVAGNRLGDAAAGGAAAAGRAQHPVEPFRVTQINAGIGPIQPGDPLQRLARGGRQTLLFVLPPPVGVEQDRGRVVEDAG